MDKLHIFALLAFAILLLSRPVLASPQINSMTFYPSQNIWLNNKESMTINVSCTDDTSRTLNVYADIVGKNPQIIIDNQTFTNDSGLYTTTLDYFIFDGKPNNFSVNVSCVNDFGESNNSIDYFTVSNFTTDISAIVNPITKSTIYLGDSDPIEVDVSVKKNNKPIGPSDPENVKFAIILDGSPVSSKIPTYPYQSDNWLIYLDPGNVSGQHTLQITTFYDRVSDTKSASFTVYDPIQFSITGISKTQVTSNATVNLQIQAFDRGKIIPLTNNLTILVDYLPATITSITPIGNYFNIAVLMPSLSSGVHTLIASLASSCKTCSDSTTIYYIVPVSGTITDENGKGVSVQLRFLANGVEKLKLSTDSNGAYSGNIPPDTYDIQAIFPQSILYLNSVVVSSFGDPIKYYYLTSVDVPGLNLAGLYVYEVALPYSRVSLEMKYDERNVLNENLIEVYRCEDWNTGRKTCYGSWEEVGASVDTIRNTVYVNTTGLSAYAIGTLMRLSPEFNLNKDKFYLKDLVSIRGVVFDENRNTVANASVRMYVKGTNIAKTVFSDASGVFSMEFLSPEIEGNYTLVLSAEKNPYLIFNSSQNLEVVESKDISIVFPDTVQIKQDENFTQEFTLVNIGQRELYNLNISLTGIPSEYYTLISSIEKLDVNEERKFSIYFSIPPNASAGTSSATLKVFNDGVSKEKIFGLTVMEKNQTAITTTPTTGLLGKIILPKIDQNLIYILLFAAISFSLAFVLKRMKIRSQSDSFKNSLWGIKDYIEKNKSEPSSAKPTRPEVTQETNPTIPIETEKPLEEDSTKAKKEFENSGDENSKDN